MALDRPFLLSVRAMSIAVAVSKNGRTVVAADTQENFGDRKLFHTDHRISKIVAVGPAARRGYATAARCSPSSCVSGSS
jgi:ATP-dependent protease HslVU (ClpYQ) peptidase subunit